MMAGVSFLRRAHRFCVPTVFCTDLHNGIRTFAAGGAASTKKAQPEKKDKKEKKQKKATKRVTGYLLFVKDNFSKYKSKDQKVVDTIREVAKEWESASTDTRQKYLDEAAKLNEMNREPPAEKPPTTAYAEYFRSIYPSISGKYPNASFAEKSQMISKLWKNMDPEEKARRQQVAAQAKLKYHQK